MADTNIMPCECGATPEVKSYMVEVEHECLEDRFYIECNRCHNRTSYGNKTMQDAIDEWNSGKRV